MKKRTLTIILTLVIVLAGFVACTEITSLVDSENTSVNTPMVEDPITPTSDPDPIVFTSLEEVEEHFLSLWKEQYEAKNIFHAPSEALEIVASPVSGMFRTSDGKIISRGSLPYETMALLEKYGNGQYDDYACHRVYQIIGSESGIIYDAVTADGKFFYSGNRLDSLLEELVSEVDNSVLPSTDLRYLISYVDTCQMFPGQGNYDEYSRKVRSLGL